MGVSLPPSGSRAAGFCGVEAIQYLSAHVYGLLTLAVFVRNAPHPLVATLNRKYPSQLTVTAQNTPELLGSTPDRLALR